jgi:hypothetical protein
MDASGFASLSKWLLLANSLQGIIHIAIVVLKISLNTNGAAFFEAWLLENEITLLFEVHHFDYSFSYSYHSITFRICRKECQC